MGKEVSFAVVEQAAYSTDPQLRMGDIESFGDNLPAPNKIKIKKKKSRQKATKDLSSSQLITSGRG